MRSITDPGELELAWSQQYRRLAEQFSRMLPKRGGVLIEIGCGKGQLTFPLAERASRFQIVGVDNFKGPYSRSHTELLSAMVGRGRKIGIRVVVSDYRDWLTRQPDSKYDAVISSEFLPEIDSSGMLGFFSDSCRVLRLGGITIHSFLSPAARNARQRRLIEADSDPKWTKTPPEEWFSPRPRLVLDYLKLAGFSRLRRVSLKSGLAIRSAAARRVLTDWDIRQSYWKSHRETLEKEGLEIPVWLIFSGTKPH